MHRTLLLLPALALLGCPSASGDDDDSSDTGPVGEAPVLQNVSMCEIAGSRQACTNAGNAGGIDLAFDVSVTDVDGDLQNPQYFILLDDSPPWLDGFFEGDLGEGGLLRITMPCFAIVPGTELAWEFAIRDSEANESAGFSGSFTVPTNPPSFGQPGACPNL